MYSTTWDVNGVHIELENEYYGDAPAPFDAGNYNRNEISATVNGHTEVFDAWGSYVHPEFDDEYSLKNIFQVIASDALTIIWNQFDEVAEMYDDPAEAARVEQGFRDEAVKMEELGLGEDILEKIANDQQWH